MNILFLFTGFFIGIVFSAVMLSLWRFLNQIKEIKIEEIDND